MAGVMSADLCNSREPPSIRVASPASRLLRSNSLTPPCGQPFNQPRMDEEEQGEESGSQEKESRRGDEAAGECGQQCKSEGGQTKRSRRVCEDSDTTRVHPMQEKPDRGGEASPDGPQREHLQRADKGEPRRCRGEVGQEAHYDSATSAQNEEASDKARQNGDAEAIWAGHLNPAPMS